MHNKREWAVERDGEFAIFDKATHCVLRTCDKGHESDDSSGAEVERWRQEDKAALPKEEKWQEEELFGNKGLARVQGYRGGWIQTIDVKIDADGCLYIPCEDGYYAKKDTKRTARPFGGCLGLRLRGRIKFCGRTRCCASFALSVSAPSPPGCLTGATTLRVSSRLQGRSYLQTTSSREPPCRCGGEGRLA